MFYRPTRLLIDTAALENNYRQIKRMVGSNCRICAVVKANAYGMGADRFSRILERCGCDAFGVATLKEAAELRNAGVKKPIILLGALYGKDSLWEALLLDLEISIHHMETFADLESLNPEERGKLRFHLKVNTGMSRLGIQPSQVESWCENAKRLNLHLNGVFTTFSSSDQKENPRTLQQLNLFNSIVEELRREGFNPPLIHAANSGAILNFPESRFNMVRPGLLMHGIPSYEGPSPKGFKPISRLESEIVQLADFPANTPIGYSEAYRIERDTRAAVIPIGYADGLNRKLSNLGFVLIKGQKAPVIGKISMDLTILDVTDIQGVTLGDKVTIIGKDGDEEITAWEMAKSIESIPWEVFCWIGPRVPRVYSNGI